MSKQEQKDERTQGREMARQNTPQGPMRTGRYPAGMLFAPADLFRMGPFSLMRRMSEEMDRVLGEFSLNRGDTRTAAWAPSIEVSQTGDKYLVRADLPGVNLADVKIEVTGEAVILEGERKSEVNENKGGVHLTERMYGRFYRAIPLPEGAKAEEAKAKFENGVLEVVVPVQAAKETRRQIPIESPATAHPENTGKAA
jgi:HSP20 family protein